MKRVGPGDSEGPDRALRLVNLLGLVVVFVGVVVPILGTPEVADGTPVTGAPRAFILLPFLDCVAGSILGGPILLGGVMTLGW